MLKLVVKSLRCTRGGRMLIPELSFTLAAHEALIVQGPNGAGKSTLLRSIAGFIPPDDGIARLEGGDDDKTLAEQCWFVGHLNAVKPQMTAVGNLRFIQAYFGASPDTTIDMALDIFDLIDVADVPAGYLSAGQKRRLGLCRMLVARRPLWLLDEPSVSLDAASVETLAHVIATHREEGGIAVIATHTLIHTPNARVIDLGAEAVGQRGVMQ